MRTLSPATLAAYLDTDYRVFGVTPFVLRIGTASRPLALLHQQAGTDCSAFVTACNPYSRLTDAATNAGRQAELASELERRGLHYLDGAGKHPDGNWPAEASFLVLGLTLEQARTLGERYEQNAIVWCGADAVPQLVLLG